MNAQDATPSASYFHGPFQQLVGYDILHNERGLYFRLPIRRDHLNPHGVLHGGVPLTLLDAMGGRSLVDCTIPETGQRILSSATITLTVTDGGVPLGTASASFQLTVTNVADAPVIVAVADRTGGAALTEDLPSVIAVTVQDPDLCNAAGAVFSLVFALN